MGTCGPPLVGRLSTVRVWQGNRAPVHGQSTRWSDVSDADREKVSGTHLGVGELALDAVEVTATGVRSLDLLALDVNGGRRAIENPYRSADHDHLTRTAQFL